MLDLGLPLDAKDPASVPLPPVPGFASLDDSLRAIVLSHGHRDHWGLIPKLGTGVPVIMGAATERIMRAAAHGQQIQVLRANAEREDLRRFRTLLGTVARRREAWRSPHHKRASPAERRAPEADMLLKSSPLSGGAALRSCDKAL